MTRSSRRPLSDFRAIPPQFAASSIHTPISGRRTCKLNGAAMSLIGQNAPDFTLPNTSREAISLSGLRGRKIVLAFYPAAFTGVCEKEMCTFRDSLTALNDLQATVFGISVDSPFSNGAFASKNDLNFDLLRAGLTSSAN